MVNIAIFASGNGSNFENIIQEINNGHVNNAVCKVLIIDKEHAYAKERAEKLHIRKSEGICRQGALRTENSEYIEGASGGADCSCRIYAFYR